MVPHTYSASTCSLSPSLSATLSGLLPSTRSCCRTYSCTSRCAVSYLSVLFVLRQHSTTRARREEGVRLIQRRVGPLTMEGCLGHFRRHNKFEKVCAQVLFLHEDQPVRSAATGSSPWGLPPPPPPPLSLLSHGSYSQSRAFVLPVWSILLCPPQSACSIQAVDARAHTDKHTHTHTTRKWTQQRTH